jgi:hypothetical protein
MTKISATFIATLTIATLYGVIFKEEYPLVSIDAGLALSFALAGLLTYLAFSAILPRARSLWSSAKD